MQFTKFTLCCAVCLCISLSSHAQSPILIKGFIKKTNDAPVFGATVIIKGHSVGAVTNSNGYYEIRTKLQENLTAEVSMMGFQSVQKAIKITSEGEYPLNFTLKEATNNLDEVLVSGKSKLRQIEALAYNVDVVDTKKLRNTTLDVGHALDRVAGVRVRESGGVGSRMNLSLNGFRGNQVKVFIDGIPMENFGSSFQLNNIPVGLADRIEVYKGVVPVGLGADALGGAINIVTNTYEKNHLDLSYSFGSFNTHRTNIDMTYVDKNDFVFHVNAFQNFSDNDYNVKVDVADLETGEYFPDQEVKRFHDQYHNETFIGNVGVVHKPYADQLLFGITLGQVYKEIQTGQRLVVVYGKRHTRSNIVMPTLKYKKDDFLVNGLDANISAAYNLGTEQVIDTVNRRYNWFGNFIQYDNPGGEQGYTNFKFKNHNGLANASFNYKIDALQSVSLSNVYTTFDRTEENLLNAEENTYNKPQKTFKNVLGLSYAFEKKNWNATLFGKNYNQVNVFEQSYNPSGNYGDVAYFDQRDQFNFFGYGVAATYFFSDDFQLKASFEHSYRLPSPQELYGDGDVTLSGNTDLDPERSNNYNVGFTYGISSKQHRINFGGTVFYRDAKDFIRPKLNQNQILQVMDNLQDVTNLGGEVQVNYNFKNKFLAGFNLTYQELRNNTQYVNGATTESIVYRDRIPNMPYFYGNANATYKFEDFLKEDNVLSLGYNLLYVHSFFRYWPSLGTSAGGNKYEIPEQIAHSFNLTYSLKHFNFTLECRNILDKRMYDNFSLQKPGRSFSGKIRYTF